MSRIYDDDFLNSRTDSHGIFSQVAHTYQRLKTETNEADLTDVQQTALEMILYKIARILNGNPNETDHWRDIAGYATLVEEHLKGDPVDET